MSILEKAVAACAARGFTFSLTQNRSGSQPWSAHALGANVEMGENGALYTRAHGFGKTADDAMTALIDALAPPKKSRVDELFG